MRTLSKYKRFLEDKDLYVKNQDFWKKTFAQISEHNFEDWVTTTFANGEDFFDGNPIASAGYPGLNKAVRIVQISSDRYRPLLRAWIQKVEYFDKSITELLLIVQPSDLAYDSVLDILSFFLVNRDTKEINAYTNAWNAFHSKAAALNRIVSTLNKVNSYGPSRRVDMAMEEFYKNNASIRKKSSEALRTHKP